MLPRRAGILLAVVPVLALLGAPWLANRDEPRVLGMPFLLAWIVAWVVLSSLAMLLLVRFGETDDAAFVPHTTPDVNADPAPAPSAGRMSLERWSVGNRGFGSLLVFVLLAGEIYTTFTFLGGSGWAYGRGAPAFYIIAYGTVAYVMSYWLLPAIWRRATAWRALTQAEFFTRAYDSRALGTLVAVVSMAALLPYLVLQLRGLGIIVSEASYGAISANAAILIGTFVTVGYVIVTGIRGSAAVAAVKDILVLVAVVALGVALPTVVAGGIGPMFARVAAERPEFLTLPAQGMSPSWFASTVLLTACGFYMWPHTFGSVFSAKGPGVFRRNAVVMPLYQLILLFVFFIGFAALLSVPGLTGSDVDLALLRATRASFGPVVVGIVGVAGLLTALVPGSMILMTTATMLARMTGRHDANGASDGGDRAMLRARLMVPVVAAVALVFTFRGGTTLVTLLLMGYSMVTQLFPALLAALAGRRWVTAQGAIAGIVTGELVVAAMTLGGLSLPALLPGLPRAITDINTGLLALACNTAVMLVVSLATQRTADGAPAAVQYTPVPGSAPPA